ncbi:hypothetical protein [Hyphomonas sp.]|uniref:hypothetical protein n=1 Tax=Hyphomonas sp. TaxID=87 RepID=UPI00391B9EF4
MSSGFTFERALAYPFAAPHFNTFPWAFGAAYAASFMAVFTIIAVIGWPALSGWVSAVATLSTDPRPDQVAIILRNAVVSLLPVGLIGGVATWVLWAMFETASQRRYIWGKPFSLGFGADEARIMVVGLLWGLIGLVIYALPAFLIVGGLLGALRTYLQGAQDDTLPIGIIGSSLVVSFLVLLLFPLYVFVATRLAPCFGLTVKDGRIRFFEAWAVSRGRFWPILMAYVILVLGGGVLFQIVQITAQLMMVPVFAGVISTEPETPAEVFAILASPGFLVPLAIYMFVVLFVQGVIQHGVSAPAALAARNDPAGSVDDLGRIQAFH